MLREAEALAVTLDDPRRLGQIARFMSFHCYQRGAYEQAIVAGQHALALATADGDGVSQVLAHRALGQAYQAHGDYRQTIEYHRQAITSLGAAQRHERFGRINLLAVTSLANLAWCLAELGMFAEGQVFGAEGPRMAETAAHPGSLMFASWGMGMLFLRQGDLPRALPLLKRAVDICQDAHLAVWFPRLAVALGAAYTLDGRIADSVPLLAQAMGQATATHMAGFQARCHLALGEAHALAELAATVALYRALDMTFWLPHAEAALAQKYPTPGI